MMTLDKYELMSYRAYQNRGRLEDNAREAGTLIFIGSAGLAFGLSDLDYFTTMMGLTAIIYGGKKFIVDTSYHHNILQRMHPRLERVELRLRGMIQKARETYRFRRANRRKQLAYENIQ